MLAIDFASPGRLWLLPAAGPLAAWIALGSRRRAREWSSLGQSGRPARDGSAGWLLAMALVVVALAQPRWGRAAGSGPPEGHDVVFCVDVSRSMGAEDASPDRLGVAVGSALALLRAVAEEPGHRASVVAFAGRAAVRCPLTSNLDAVAEALRALRPGEVEPGGTDLGAALGVAIEAFDPEGPAQGRTVVLFTDGEDHAGSWPGAVERLRGSGVLVHSVVVGDPERGHPVPPRAVRDPSRPDPGPSVETRRSDEAPGSVARETGGALIPLGLASADLGALYRERIAPTARRRRDEIRPPERVERFPIFLLAALATGLVGSWPRRAGRRPRRLALVVPALASMAIGAGPESAAVLVESGRSAYDAGRFAEALGAFERAIALAPAAAIPRYDAASALFRLGRYPEAIARYEEARKLGDPGLATKIDYALGNAHLARGDVPGALARYDACLGSTWPGPAFDAVRRDAAENRAFAARRMTPPEGTGGDAPRAPRPDRPRGPRGGGPGEAGRDGPGSPSPSSPGDQAGGKAPPPRPDGRPGEDDPDRPPSGSPEARLDDALREVRESRKLRPPDAPPASLSGSSKDW